MKASIPCPTCNGEGAIRPWENWEPFNEAELENLEEEIVSKSKAHDQGQGVTLGYTRRLLATIRQLKKVGNND